MPKAYEAASGSLAQVAKSLRYHRANVQHRIDISSPQLCDDVLQRLGPSLEKHKGCTIIDFHPGIGLWSSKIHDVLQPRKHILIEPSGSPFLPRLQALVDQQDSRYHITEETGRNDWEPDRFVADGLLPPFPAAQPTAPNNEILMLVSGALSPLLTKTAQVPSFQRRLRQWCRDINSQSGFHANGPVRMLAWAPEKEKAAILPYTVLHRSLFSLELEMNCHIEKIVTSAVVSRQQRDQSVELMSRQRVARRMQELGVKIPSGRQNDLRKDIQEVLAPPDDNETSPQVSTASLPARGWHDELQDLRQQFQAGGFARSDAELPGKAEKKVPKGAVKTPEYLRMIELERNLKFNTKRSGEIDIPLREQAGIDALDSQAHDPTLDEAKRLVTLQELQERKAKLKQYLELKSSRLRLDFEFYKQDRRAFARNPPLLMWDRRIAEPLRAYGEEFHPQRDMCLLDVEPCFPPPYPLTFAAQASFFQMLMTALFQNASDNLRTLDKIAPGAFDAITPKVPALRDPARGGERDLQDLPIRRLTPEMAHGLLLAWFEWPSKPELSYLLTYGAKMFTEAPRPE
ncbi:MAG: hypothetical protein Q9228_001033 [Teloschistes exilis]